MSRRLDWNKDRERQLRARACAEEIRPNHAQLSSVVERPHRPAPPPQAPKAPRQLEKLPRGLNRQVSKAAEALRAGRPIPFKSDTPAQTRDLIIAQATARLLRLGLKHRVQNPSPTSAHQGIRTLS